MRRLLPVRGMRWLDARRRVLAGTLLAVLPLTLRVRLLWLALVPGIAGLRRDVDTGDDLRAAERLGLGPRTSAVAAELLRAAG